MNQEGKNCNAVPFWAGALFGAFHALQRPQAAFSRWKDRSSAIMLLRSDREGNRFPRLAATPNEKMCDCKTTTSVGLAGNCIQHHCRTANYQDHAPLHSGMQATRKRLQHRLKHLV
jgi:hypothetical protein